ncbi:MAG: NAD(P)H-hydrate dehydratase [Candidatus Neomarinimicrobiota bacterium]
MKVAQVAEMQALDRQAVAVYGIPEELLMENAGLAVTAVVERELGICQKKFAVICGPGNNGGDGFVVARKIHSLGGTPLVLILGKPDSYKGAAGLNLKILRALPVAVEEVKSGRELQTALADSDGVIDAIFGTGLTRTVDGIFREAIDLINASGKPVVAVDIPSGIDGNTGQILGSAVTAGWTVTFGLPKTGNLLYPGFSHCGELSVTHISFPPELSAKADLQVAINTTLPLPRRDPAGHKGSFGDVLFIAGATNYLGAPYYSARSFLKAGGGYSRLAAPRSIVPALAAGGSEIVFHPQLETAAGSLSLSNLDGLIELAAQVDLVVLGPGLSLDQETQALVQALVPRIERPLLIDGDGITAVAAYPQLLRDRGQPTILTPHTGELARLTGQTPTAMASAPIAIVQETAQKLNSIIVHKGAHTLIGLPDGKVSINLSGNSGMASAGAGDVLTGAIAAMYGLGLPLIEAVRKGVFIHGLAGDLAAWDHGEDGITASDIMDCLPWAVQCDRTRLPEELEKKYRVEIII